MCENGKHVNMAPYFAYKGNMCECGTELAIKGEVCECGEYFEPNFPPWGDNILPCRSCDPEAFEESLKNIEKT